MVTYEIALFDSACGNYFIPVPAFIPALRIYQCITLNSDSIFGKEMVSIDHDKKIRMVIESERL